MVGGALRVQPFFQREIFWMEGFLIRATIGFLKIGLGKNNSWLLAWEERFKGALQMDFYPNSFG